MMAIDKTTGKGCAWCIASRGITLGLIAEGIVNQVIAKRPYYKSHIFLQVVPYREDIYVNPAYETPEGGGVPEETFWAPSFLDREAWERAIQKFRLYRPLDENVVHYLLPEMVDYLQTIPDTELVSMTRDFLIEYGVINQPIRQYNGATYYFNEDEIYSKDKAKLFPVEGLIKFNIFKITGTGTSFFSTSVWRKAATQFEVGMTLTECIEIFLNTELTFQPPPEPAPVDRLVQRIALPVFERTPGNQNEATFDRIRIMVSLPRYQFDSWNALRDAVKKYQQEIVQRVVQKLEGNRQFKGYGVPVNFLKLSSVTLLRDFSLEFIFELKEPPAKNP